MKVTRLNRSTVEVELEKLEAEWRVAEHSPPFPDGRMYYVGR